MKVTQPRPYIEYELLSEIFEFVPTALLDDMYNLSNILFYKVMEGTAEKLTAAKPEKLREINLGLDKFEKITEMQLDRVFNVLQQYIQQQWRIPQDLDIELDHHKDLNFAVTEQDNQNIDDKLTKMQEYIIQQKKFKAILTQTQKDNTLQNTIIDQQIQNVSLLNDIATQKNVNNVHESLEFVKNHIKLLENSVNESEQEQLAYEASDKSQELERVAYIREKIQEAILKL